MLNEKYRKLYNEEIDKLTRQGCYCKDWNKIEVIDTFLPDHLINVHFSGFNRIGRFDEEIIIFGNVQMTTGIFNSGIHNCIIENNALIKGVKSGISNLRIGERIVICNKNGSTVENERRAGSGPVMWLISAQEYKLETANDRNLINTNYVLTKM